MAKLTECDYCGEQLLDSSSILANWIRETENELDFCGSDCQSAWHDENEPDSDNNELVEIE